MKNIIFLIFALSITILSGCGKDFLDREPLDTETINTYWTTESNVRTYSYGFYTRYFEGYGSGFSWPKYTFLVQSLNDDCGPTTPTTYIKTVPATASAAGWNFTWVRKANDFIENIPKVNMSEEALNHWLGIARFFRAMEYSNLVFRFGDVPWIDEIPTENDTLLMYRPRDPRTFVMDKVLEDFNFAKENVRLADGVNGLNINRYVVLAFMSRVFLYEGTFLKYHDINLTKANEYLQAAKDAADLVIASGVYQIENNYRGMFNSLDLAGNKEVMLFRSYVTGVITHSINSYVNKEAQTGVNKNAIESYLCTDGLPISLSLVYQGDTTVQRVFTNRDSRLYATVAQEFRVQGNYGSANHPGPYNYSTTGYALNKFLNEAIQSATEGNSSLNPTDGPVIRYGEVLLNYAEACAELGILTQADLDKSINVLRNRAIPATAGTYTKLPPLQVNGGNPAINGVVYDDTKRDNTVSSMIWEIRRERRIELMAEGFRFDDLRRWKKLEYTDTKANVDINRGAYIKKSEYPGATQTLTEVTYGYIIPCIVAASEREFIAPANPRIYLYPLPTDQIKLYLDRGIVLTQNPGWE